MVGSRSFFISSDLKAVFDSFDKDGKGTLSRKELKDALKLSDEGLDEILKDVDKNGKKCQTREKAHADLVRSTNHFYV